MPTGEFRPIVAADRQRLSAFGHNCFQHSRHSPAGETGVDFQRQTLSRVSIHHAQHTDGSAALYRVVHKVQRPLLIGRSSHHERLSLPHAMLSLLPPDRQSRLPIHPMQPLVVHVLSASLQQHLQSPIPGARLLPRQLHQLRPQRLICSQRPVTYVVTAMVIRPQARRSLKAYSCCTCSIAAFSATSSNRFFGSPTVVLPCPDSDPPPASAASCSHPAVAWLPAPGSHPSHRILLSTRRSCVSIRLPPAPRLPLYVPLPVVSAPR